MWDQSGRTAAAVALWHRTMPVSPNRLAAWRAVMADAVLVLLIMLAGIVSLSPFSAAAAARELIAGRRAARCRNAELGPVWARQVQRNAALRSAPPLSR